MGLNPTVPVPSGYASGDILIIVSVSGTLTTPTGWTLIGTNNAWATAYYKVASASESSVAMTGGTATNETVMLCYRGLIGFDSSSTPVNNTTAGTSVTTNTLTTTAANDLVVSVYGANIVGSPTFTAPGSTTSRVNIPGVSGAGGNFALLVVDEKQASVGTSTTRTAALSSSDVNGALSFSFKANQSNFFLMF